MEPPTNLYLGGSLHRLLKILRHVQRWLSSVTAIGRKQKSGESGRQLDLRWRGVSGWNDNQIDRG